MFYMKTVIDTKRGIDEKDDIKSLRSLKRDVSSVMVYRKIKCLLSLSEKYNIYINDDDLKNKIDILYVSLVSILFKYNRIKTKKMDMTVPNTIYGFSEYFPKRKYSYSYISKEVDDEIIDIYKKLDNLKFDNNNFNKKHITFKDGCYYYHGILINFGKKGKAYKYFDILYRLVPNGGRVTYKNFKKNIKFNSKSNSDFNINKEIQNNLTSISSGVLLKIKLINQEYGIKEGGHVLIKSKNIGGYIEFNNKI